MKGRAKGAKATILSTASTKLSNGTLGVTGAGFLKSIHKSVSLPACLSLFPPSVLP